LLTVVSWLTGALTDVIDEGVDDDTRGACAPLMECRASPFSIRILSY
jgi:hypothetical protein